MLSLGPSALSVSFPCESTGDSGISCRDKLGYLHTKYLHKTHLLLPAVKFYRWRAWTKVKKNIKLPAVVVKIFCRFGEVSPGRPCETGPYITPGFPAPWYAILHALQVPMTGPSVVIMGTLATKVPFPNEQWDLVLCPHFWGEVGAWQSETEEQKAEGCE